MLMIVHIQEHGDDEFAGGEGAEVANFDGEVADGAGAPSLFFGWQVADPFIIDAGKLALLVVFVHFSSWLGQVRWVGWLGGTLLL